MRGFFAQALRSRSFACVGSRKEVTPRLSKCRESRQHSSEADHAFSQRFGDAGGAYAHRWIHAGRHLAHPKAESRNNEPQTHHNDTGPHPGEKRPLVSENLSFDLVRVEPPLFVLSIRHLVEVVVHLSLRFATRTRPCAQRRGM